MENDFTKYLLAASKELQQPKSEVSDIKEEIFVIGELFSFLNHHFCTYFQHIFLYNKF